MNLKSLLIGSAAALVAAPAFAADVIIAEPEPVEYVEVCDVAGAGYFYIPGSRTCLKIGGLVRHELSFAQSIVARTVTDVQGNVTTVRDAEFQDGWNSLVRAELTAATFTETELGDLTSFIKFRANDRNANSFSIVANVETGDAVNVQGASLNGATFLQEATIGLGGLLLGLTDTLMDGGINGEFDSTGGDRVHTIRYTADLGAFSASIGAEVERADFSQNDFVPNVVGKLSGDLGAFSVDLFAAYDDADDRFFVNPRVATAAVAPVIVNDVNGNPITVTPGVGAVTARAGLAADDEFSLKARVGADFGPAALQAVATYNSGVNYYDNDYEFSVGASAKIGLGEKASLTFGGQYFANQLVNRNFVTVNGVDLVTADTIDGADGYSIGANVDYEIVDGFDVKIAVNYIDKDTGVFVADAVNDTLVESVLDDDGLFSGFIRFDRSF